MFRVGLIGEKQISAFSICFQVEGFAWMVILSIFCASIIFLIIECVTAGKKETIMFLVNIFYKLGRFW